jgi:hypothetical protein
MYKYVSTRDRGALGDRAAGALTWLIAAVPESMPAKKAAGSASRSPCATNTLVPELGREKPSFVWHPTQVSIRLRLNFESSLTVRFAVESVRLSGA